MSYTKEQIKEYLNILHNYKNKKVEDSEVKKT